MGLMAIVPIGPVDEELYNAHIDGALQIIFGAWARVLTLGGAVINSLYQQLAEKMALGEEADQDAIADLRDRIDACNDALYASSETALDETDRVLGLSPDTYSLREAFMAFSNAFHATINDLCPVRTGFLRSTCNCILNGETIICFANAEYAQYVEYGTSRMSAQPYFEPAIEDGIRAMKPILDDMADRANQGSISDGRRGAVNVQGAAANESFDIASAIDGVAMFILGLLLIAIKEIIQYILDDVFDYYLSNYEIMII